MKRIALKDQTSRWFNIEEAKKFSEKSIWNGRNNISLATGDQFFHEALYRTKSNVWVLNEWSQYQGSSESYVEITDQKAAEWFIKNQYEDDHIPDDILIIISKHIDDLEI